MTEVMGLYTAPPDCRGNLITCLLGKFGVQGLPLTEQVKGSVDRVPTQGEPAHGRVGQLIKALSPLGKGLTSILGV